VAVKLPPFFGARNAGCKEHGRVRRRREWGMGNQCRLLKNQEAEVLTKKVEEKLTGE